MPSAAGTALALLGTRAWHISCAEYKLMQDVDMSECADIETETSNLESQGKERGIIQRRGWNKLETRGDQRCPYGEDLS